VNTSLNRVTVSILVAFALIALSLTYWSVLDADSMLARSDNPRLVEAERAIVRGAIYDRNGELLAQTTQVGVSPSGKPVLKRQYLHVDAASAVGYYSLIHGVGGAEAVFDRVLRGDDLRDAAQIAVDNLLHRPQVGSAIRLTIDSKLQSAIVDAMQGKQGAVIAIDVPSGAVLAMVNAPSFDPNTLDATYNTLRSDPSAPLLNRVTQGIYQPGGALQTVILAAILADKPALDAPVAGGSASMQVNGLTLKCAMPGLANSVERAYALACPSPFANAVTEQPGPAAVQKMLSAFGLLQPPTLDRFATVSGKPVTVLTDITDPAQLRAQGVGQGELTVTPLQMALVACTIANHGHAITPYLADATRPPNTADWQPLPLPETQPAVITRDMADKIRTAMQQAVNMGAAQPAGRTGLSIFGHASVAYTGPKVSADSWFIGFIDLAGGRSVAVAVVIEDSTDAGVAAQIGGAALAAANH
jgi:peptidoglycan glycosyltransferase